MYDVTSDRNLHCVWQQNTIEEGVDQLNKAWDEYGINFLVSKSSCFNGNSHF
jgi:uncharacterized protein YcsI (UPF0317 family)